MPQSTEGRVRRGRLFDGTHGRVRSLGNGALDFARWFFRSKYRLMAEFLGELEQAPQERDEAALRERYCRAITHAQRVLALRLVVTVLLALGVVTAAFATVMDALVLPPVLSADVDTLRFVLRKVAAWSASASLVLVALRLGFDRYLGLVDVSATFLAMQIASAAPRPEPGSSSRSPPLAR